MNVIKIIFTGSLFFAVSSYSYAHNKNVETAKTFFTKPAGCSTNQFAYDIAKAGTLSCSKVPPAGLDSYDNPSNGECLTYRSATTQFEWATCGTGGGGSSDTFKTMNAPSGTDPVASGSDTLNFAASGIMSITGDSSTKTLTFSATEVDADTTNELQNIFQTVAGSSGSSSVADSTTDTLTLSGTSPVSVSSNSSTDTITFSLSDVSDCSANQFVNGVSANLSLVCAQPAFSNLSGNATVGQGGTGLTSYTIGSILYASDTSVLTAIPTPAPAATPAYLQYTGGATPSWGKVRLADGVTGTLPAGNGGTGSTYVTFSGPTAARTFTLPDSSVTIQTALAGGDVTTTSGGASATIGDEKVTEAKLKTIDTPAVGEALTYTTTSGYDFEWKPVASGDASGNATTGDNANGFFAGAGALEASKGGTGQTSYTAGNILYASDTTTITVLPTPAATARYLTGGTSGSSTPSWSQVSLTSGVSGTLPLASLTDDDVTANKCLVSGGSGAGVPNWASCPAGSSSFSSLTNGTNNSAAMVIDTGASLTYANSGTITATSGDSATSFFPSGAIEATRGGTGIQSYTAGDILYASTSTAITALPTPAATARYLTGGTSGGSAPSWSQVSLTSGVSGILPVSNGGTGANLNTLLNGNLIYASGSTTMAPLPTPGPTPQYLQGNGSSLSWSTSLYPSSLTVTASDGSNGITFTNNVSATPAPPASGSTTVHTMATTVPAATGTPLPAVNLFTLRSGGTSPGISMMPIVIPGRSTTQSIGFTTDVATSLTSVNGWDSIPIKKGKKYYVDGSLTLDASSGSADPNVSIVLSSTTGAFFAIRLLCGLDAATAVSTIELTQSNQVNRSCAIGAAQSNINMIFSGFISAATDVDSTFAFKLAPNAAGTGNTLTVHAYPVIRVMEFQ